MPTVIESGVPGYEVVQWYGVLAPAGTPRDIVMKINADMVKFLASPDMAAKMASEGGIPESSTPEQFGALIKSEIERWGVVIVATGRQIRNNFPCRSPFDKLRANGGVVEASGRTEG